MVSIAWSGLTSERTSRITCSNDFSDFEAGVTVNAWMIAATKTGNPVRERCEFDKLASRMTSSVAIDLSHHGKGRENAKAQLADLDVEHMIVGRRNLRVAAKKTVLFEL